MNIDVNVNEELISSLVDAINRLTDQLGLIVGATVLPENPVETAEPLPDVPEEKPKKATKKKAAKKEEDPPISETDLRNKVITLASQGSEMKAQVRSLVREYAENVVAVPEDKRAELWARLDELEG